MMQSKITFYVVTMALAANLVSSLSINPMKQMKKKMNNSQDDSSSSENFRLTKKSTALDVLNSLNKNSKLASYVTNDTSNRKPVVIVTGGSSGIGIPSVETLALSGMKVVLCARNVTAAKEIIQTKIPPSLRSDSSIRVQKLDLADMESIKNAVDDIVKSECEDGGEIAVLLNNAGVMAPPTRMGTEQGLELQFGTNHVGHHMLTRLILPFMKDDGRIVTVASTAHSFGSIDFDNLNYDEGKPERSYSAWGAYGQSKLANILFAKGLDTKLKEAGSDIKAVSLHPGVIGTNLWRYSPKWTAPFLNAIVADKTIEQGAATNVFCCLADSSEFNGGEYVKDCQITNPNRQGQDEYENLRNELWTATESLIRDSGYELPAELN